MEGRIELLIDNEREMVQLGKALAEASGGHAVIYLEGNLGAGKTTLCRGILHSLGHQGAVKSPTYSLVEPYHIEGQQIYHFDLYRLADPEELEFIGGRDYFAENGLYLIEWPCKGEGALPDADLEVQLNYHLPGRKALIKSGSEHGQAMLKKLQGWQEGECRRG